MTDGAFDELAARTLRLSLADWRRVLERHRPDGGVGQRLKAFAAAFESVCPPRPVPSQPERRCPVCGGRCRPAVAGAAGLLYGRCDECGHGVLLSPPAPAAVYLGDGYFEQKAEAGVGYDGYAAEREYREGKGAALVQQMLDAHGAGARDLLEVGSGFGFTRAAAAKLGLSTRGVDLNPRAAAAAAELYGFETFTGTLGEALATAGSGVQPGAHALVLFQFVLEHVGDVAAELRHAASALAPGGVLCLVVPSMEAAEIDVFGGAYRSFRADHLHLFTAHSLRLLLQSAGLDLISVASTCNLHLLRPALSAAELRSLYDSGAGPDLVVHARRSSR